jgi:antitoxin MazE
MTGTIQKWGNSQAIRLPRHILDITALKENDSVQISVENNQIVIKKTIPKPEHRTLKQRIEDFYGKDFETVLQENPYEYEEIKASPPIGSEVW